MEAIEDCLVIAAGKGTRLRSQSDLKPLVEICGAPLIEHAMAAAVVGGARRFIVITGFQAPVLEAELARIRERRGWRIITAFNPRFEESNGRSVLRGEPFLRGPFYLAMCDHIVDPNIYRCLRRQVVPTGAVALGVDFRLSNPDVDLDDVTRVRARDGRVVAIGKALIDYNGFDTGVFRAERALFESIRLCEADGDCSISRGMKRLADNGAAIAVDIGDDRWIDVDCETTLIRAREWIGLRREQMTMASGGARR